VGRKPADWQVPAVLRDPWTWRGMLFRCGACCCCTVRSAGATGQCIEGLATAFAACDAQFPCVPPCLCYAASLRAVVNWLTTQFYLLPRRRFATRVWEWGVTPGSIVRCWGPWGPSLTKKYCRSRFTRQQQLTDAEVDEFEVRAGRLPCLSSTACS